MKKKPIVISMGEPSGIGTEILLKSWIKREQNKLTPFFVIDNCLRFQSMIDYLKLKATIREIKNPSETANVFEYHIPIYNIGKKISFKLGTPDKGNSKYIIESIRRVLILSRKIKHPA